MGSIETRGTIGATKALSNLSNVAINTALLPESHNTLDFGADANRWKDGYFQGTLTVYDLIVESGSSIKLAGATFENQGHYTSVNTNWMVQHGDQDTAFMGVYAESTGVMTHANLVLDAQGSAFNLIKSAPTHPTTPNAAGPINEDGDWRTFVDHTSEMSWQHFTSLTKDAYGNITGMTGEQRLMSLDDDNFMLEEVDLQILDIATEDVLVHLSSDSDCYIDNTYSFGIGTQTPAARLESLSTTGDQLRLSYDATKYATFEVKSDGTMFIDNVLGEIGFGSDVKAAKFIVDGVQDYTIYENNNSLYIAESLYFSSSTQAWYFNDGTVWIGSDTMEGLLELGGIDGGDQGAEVRLRVPADHATDISYYDMEVYEDDLTFGPNTDPDAFKFTATGTAVVAAFNVDLTVNDSIGITAGTEDYYFKLVDNNLEIGGDNPITYYTASGYWNLGQLVRVGEWGLEGLLEIHAEDGGTAAPALDMYVGGDYDNDIAYYRMQTSEDDWQIGPVTDPDAFKFTGNGTAVTAAFNVDTTVNGNLTLPATESYGIVYADPSGNLTTSVNFKYDTADFYCLLTGNPYFVKSGNQEIYVQSTTDSAATINFWSGTAGGIQKGIIGYNASDYLVLAHSETGVTKDSDGIRIKEGKVSIGDVSIPGSYVLDVASSGDDPVQFRRGSNNSVLFKMDSGATDIRFGGNKTNNRIGTWFPESFGIVSNSTERITIESDGDVVIAENLGIGVTPERPLHLRDSSALIRIDRDANSPSVMLCRFPSGDYSTPWKSFVFGANASGVNDGEFFINDTAQGVGGGGDRRFTIENDGDIVVEESLGVGISPTYDFHVEKDVAGYVTSRVYNSNVDGITEHLVGANGGGHIIIVANSSGSSHYDIPASSAGIAATWGNKLTISVGDSGNANEMMQFNAATGVVTVSADLDIAEIVNAGDLKLQPDVGGDVILFGDTDVGNAETGKELRVCRQAAEGNEYMRFYITASQDAMIHSSADLTMQGQTIFTINSVTKDINLKVGDNAGAKKVYFKDSDGTVVGQVDSLGNAQFDGTLTTDGGIETDAVLFPDGSTIGNASSPFTWHIGNAKHEQTKDVDAECDGPCGVALSTDGEKMFVVDNQLNKVFEYDLSTAWDVSTATYNIVNITPTGSNNPQGIYFRPDGLKMYLADAADDEVNEYDLAVAWDLSSSVTWVGLKSLPTLSPNGVFFRPDGRRMFVSNGFGDNVQQYTLTEAWDVTTASWTNSFSTSIDAIEDVAFSPDGTKMYIVDGSTEDDIHEFTLGTPWQVNTASLHNLYHIWEDSVPNGICFKPDGTRMYVVGNSTDSIYGYHMGMVIEGHVAIGHGGEWGSLPLDVRSADDNQIIAYDVSPQAAGIGGGILLGAAYTDAGDVAIGSRLSAKKVNSTSGNYDFDLLFEVQNTSASLTERMRISTQGEARVIADANRTLHLNRNSNAEDGSAQAILLFGCRTDPTLQQKAAVIFKRTNIYGKGDLLLCVNGDSNNDDADDGDAVITLASGHVTLEKDTTVNGVLEVATSIGIGIDVPMEEFHIKSDHPTIAFEEQDAGSNEGIWEFGAANEEFTLKSVNDLHSGAQTVWKASGRGGTSVTEFSIPNARVAIGTDGAATSAALEISSTSGALLVPRMTTTQRGLLTPVNGMIIYDTSQNAFRKYQNGAWASF